MVKTLPEVEAAIAEYQEHIRDLEKILTSGSAAGRTAAQAKLKKVREDMALLIKQRSRLAKGLGQYDIPLPPPACDTCGVRHPHFIHGSGRGVRGAGRPIRGAPHTQFLMHMTPNEMDSMIYGPMFENFMRQRGMMCPAGKWEHSPGTSREQLHGLGNENKKLNTIWVALGLLALFGLLTSGNR